MKAKFIWFGLLSFFIFFLGVAGFCYVIDPFGVYLRFKIPGINAAKPFAGDYERFWKPYGVYLHRPDGIILGSSRLLANIDPHHPGLAPFAKKVYNLAVSAGKFYESYRYFLHANAVSDLSLAIIGLDSSMFYTGQPPDKVFDSAALLTQPGSLSYEFFKLGRETLFSSDAIKTSWATLMSQEEVLSQQEGFYSSWWGKNKTRLFQEAGHHAFFRHWEGKLLRKFLKNKKNPWEDVERGKGIPFDVFREVLRICAKNKIRLILFINPTHARTAELVRVRGDWPHYENWKRALVRVVAEESESAPENLVSLWDFGVYNSVTAESLPPPGDKTTRMKYFWEVSHYNIHTGNLVLDRVLGYKESSREVPQDFGILLTPDNIESHIISDREKQKTFIRDYPDYVREIQETWEEVRGELLEE